MGPSSRLAVPSGMAGFFLAIGETCAWGWAVLWGSKGRSAQAAGFLLMPQHQATGAKKDIHATSCLVSWGGNKLLDSQCITNASLLLYSTLLYSPLLYSTLL